MQTNFFFYSKFARAGGRGWGSGGLSSRNTAGSYRNGGWGFIVASKGLKRGLEDMGYDRGRGRSSCVETMRALGARL